MPIRIFCFLALVFIAPLGNAQQTSDTPSDGSRQLQLNLEHFPDDAKKEELQLDLKQFDEAPSGESGLDSGQSKQLELNLEQFENDDQIDNQKSEENLELNLEQFEKSDSEKESELNLEQFDKSTDGKLSADGAAEGAKEAEGSVYNTRFIIIVGSLVALVILYLLFKRRRRR